MLRRCGRGSMPVVKRRLFNLAAVASLLLCVATVALWTLGRTTWTFRGVTLNTSALLRDYESVRPHAQPPPHLGRDNSVDARLAPGFVGVIGHGR
jgi:hypothetical protein